MWALGTTNRSRDVHMAGSTRLHHLLHHTLEDQVESFALHELIAPSVVVQSMFRLFGLIDRCLCFGLMKKLMLWVQVCSPMDAHQCASTHTHVVSVEYVLRMFSCMPRKI